MWADTSYIDPSTRSLNEQTCIKATQKPSVMLRDWEGGLEKPHKAYLKLIPTMRWVLVMLYSVACVLKMNKKWNTLEMLVSEEHSSFNFGWAPLMGTGGRWPVPKEGWVGDSSLGPGKHAHISWGRIPPPASPRASKLWPCPLRFCLAHGPSPNSSYVEPILPHEGDVVQAQQQLHSGRQLTKAQSILGGGLAV